MFVSPAKASQHYKVSKETLRLWSLSGKIKTVSTKGGHHRYQILPLHESKPSRKTVIYARVSSSKQKKDLEKQIDYVRKKYPEYEVIKDIGSGFNFERRGFISLLEQVMYGNVKEIVTAHPDRLTRIGFKFIQFICKQHKTKLTVLSSKKDCSQKTEFTEEFISVITYYTSKFYGMRKYNI